MQTAISRILSMRAQTATAVGIRATRARGASRAPQLASQSRRFKPSPMRRQRTSDADRWRAGDDHQKHRRADKARRRCYPGCRAVAGPRGALALGRDAVAWGARTPRGALATKRTDRGLTAKGDAGRAPASWSHCGESHDRGRSAGSRRRSRHPTASPGVVRTAGIPTARCPATACDCTVPAPAAGSSRRNRAARHRPCAEL